MTDLSPVALTGVQVRILWGAPLRVDTVDPECTTANGAFVLVVLIPTTRRLPFLVDVWRSFIALSAMGLARTLRGEFASRLGHRVCVRHGLLIPYIPLWWNGRHLRFKPGRRKACEFDSRWGDHILGHE